jgi:hemerythrin-like metal-binding protein
MRLLWNNEMKLGIKIIDEQHENFVSAINNLISVVGEIGTNKQAAQNIFGQLNEYVVIHFSTEEKYFHQFNYPDKDAHIEEHHKFIDKLAEIKKEYLNDAISASFNLADYLEDWLIYHVQNLDKKYVQCFHDHGLY